MDIYKTIEFRALNLSGDANLDMAGIVTVIMVMTQILGM